MKGLLYKDFFLLRSSLIFMGVFQLLVSGGAILTAVLGLEWELTVILLTACYYLPFLILTILTQQLFLYDEKRSWRSFAGSTPASIKGQILEKYYMILLLNILLLFCCFLTDVVVVAIAKDMMISMSIIAMLIFCVQMFFQAIEIPFVIRFGTAVGGSVKGALLACLLFIVICYGLFGNISFLFEQDVLTAFMEWIRRGNVMWTLAAFPYVAVAAYYLSYRISVKIYKGVDYSE